MAATLYSTLSWSTLSPPAASRNFLIWFFRPFLAARLRSRRLASCRICFLALLVCGIARLFAGVCSSLGAPPLSRQPVRHKKSIYGLVLAPARRDFDGSGVG